jgi:hypothetical protein
VASAEPGSGWTGTGGCERRLGPTYPLGADGARPAGPMREEAAVNVLWAIVAIVLVLWLIGAVINVVGALIHLLLLVAVIIAVVALFQRNRRV